MLKFLRKKNIAKIVFWALVILIMPAFVLWGTGSLSGSKDKGPKSVGTIGGKKISFEDFYYALNGARCQIVLFYFAQPKMLDTILQDKALMGKLAWDRILMLKEADRNKIKASDKEVVAFVRTHPIFNRNGAFDTAIYEHVLRYNIGLDARAFEEIVRENIKIKKLNDIITKDVAVTDDDILSEYKMALRTEPFDEEKFKKDKDEFAKAVLDMKRNRVLEPWLANLESQAKLNIDLKEYEKYYR